MRALVGRRGFGPQTIVCEVMSVVFGEGVMKAGKTHKPSEIVPPDEMGLHPKVIHN